MKVKKIIGLFLVAVIVIAIYVGFTVFMIPTDSVSFFGIMMSKWIVFPLAVMGAAMLTAFLVFLAWCFQV
jgi:hypothetical protein